MNVLIYREDDRRVIGGFSWTQGAIQIMPRPYQGQAFASVSATNYDAAMSQLGGKEFVVENVDGTWIIAPYTPPPSQLRYYAALDGDGRIAGMNYAVMPSGDSYVEITEQDFADFSGDETRDDGGRQLIVRNGRIEKLPDDRAVLTVAMTAKFVDREKGGQVIDFSYSGLEREISVLYVSPGGQERIVLMLDPNGTASVPLQTDAPGKYALRTDRSYRIEGVAEWEVGRVWKSVQQPESRS
jgi:hypothetical protein